MSWFADLAGKAEHLLNNLDAQTGVALRSHSAIKPKKDRTEYANNSDRAWNQSVRKKPILRPFKKLPIDAKPNSSPSRKLSPTTPNTQSHINSRSFNKNVSVPQVRKTQFSLHNCPKTVGDVKEVDGYREHYRYGPPKRRKIFVVHLLLADLYIIFDCYIFINLQDLVSPMTLKVLAWKIHYQLSWKIWK